MVQRGRDAFILDRLGPLIGGINDGQFLVVYKQCIRLDIFLFLRKGAAYFNDALAVFALDGHALVVHLGDVLVVIVGFLSNNGHKGEIAVEFHTLISVVS